MVKKNYLKSIIPSFISGILGSIIVVFLFQFLKSESHFATVNITGLIDQFIKLETKKHTSPDVLKRDVLDFGKTLEIALKDLSQKKHLVILPSEAVIAGCPDYTDFVKQTMRYF